MTFKIKTHDFSKCVVVGEYAINKEDVYDEWTDGDMKKRRHLYRKKIKGTLRLKFMTEAKMHEFQKVICNSTWDGGQYIVVCDVVNTGEKAIETEAYIEVKPIANIVGKMETMEECIISMEEV